MALGEYIKQICKIGQGNDCCRYLISGPKGLECAKHSPEIKDVLDHRAARKTITAQADNCDGYPITTDINELPLPEQKT